MGKIDGVDSRFGNDDGSDADSVVDGGPIGCTSDCSDSCTPLSCSEIPDSCDVVDDGCGHLIPCTDDCPDSCTPLSCADIPDSCGGVDDGCGHLIPCTDGCPAEIRTEGDSGMQGAYGFNLYESISAATSRPVISTARGGSTFAEVRDRILGDSSQQNKTTVIDDMSPNGFATIEDFMADARAIVAFLGHDRYVFVASITPPPTSGAGCNDSQMGTTDAIKAALVAEFGAEHVLDVIPALQAMSDGSADDTHDVTVCSTFPRSLLADGTHLTQAGIDVQAALVPAAVGLVEGL